MHAQRADGDPSSSKHQAPACVQPLDSSNPAVQPRQGAPLTRERRDLHDVQKNPEADHEDIRAHNRVHLHGEACGMTRRFLHGGHAQR